MYAPLKRGERCTSHCNAPVPGNACPNGGTVRRATAVKRGGRCWCTASPHCSSCQWTEGGRAPDGTGRKREKRTEQEEQEKGGKRGEDRQRTQRDASWRAGETLRAENCAREALPDTERAALDCPGTSREKKKLSCTWPRPCRLRPLWNRAGEPQPSCSLSAARPSRPRHWRRRSGLRGLGCRRSRWSTWCGGSRRSGC